MAFLDTLAWKLFRAADTTIVRSGLRRSRVGRESLSTLNRFGTRVLHHVLIARSRPFRVHGHWMHLANSGSPSVAFTLSMILDRYEPGTTRLFEQVLKPGMTVVDVGAHAGYFALLAARLVGPQGRVFALEPAESNFELLQKNILLNSYRNVTSLCVAAADCSGRKKLFLDAKGNDRNSLMPGSGFRAGLSTEVDTVSLDDLLEQNNIGMVDLLKIDAEGGEYAILKGLSRTLGKRKVHRMAFEFSPAACTAVGVTPEAFLGQLIDSGLTVYRIESTGAILESPMSDHRRLGEQIRAMGACNLLASIGGN